MTIREQLEMYRNGTLPQAEQEMLKEEIEKHEAINDFLYDESDISQLDDLQDLSVAPENSETDAQSAEFAKMIKSSIRRAFIKMGVSVGAVILALILLVIFVLPGTVSKLYYNPNEIVGNSKSASQPTKRIDLDLSVYTELFIPGNFRNYAVVEDRGYGEYDISIPQVSSFNGQFISVNGKITRNSLTLYNENVFKTPFINSFAVFDGQLNSNWIKDAFESLDYLKNTYYTAYFTLDKPTDYGEFYKWYRDKDFNCSDLWCGIDAAESPAMLVGIYPEPSGYVYSYDNEKYPKLNLLDYDASTEQLERDAASTKSMKTHFISMLKYMDDHPDTADMFGVDYFWNETIEYIEENGFKTYGFAVTADKETIKKIANEDKISYVYTTPLYNG
ncbi:MAG: anti sigma factor C-terminal domain-containing protein [Ruminococcus sp.]|nr:anti sigma factor C-terminal domain-containing protein [Ruminococcus sp.]